MQNLGTELLTKEHVLWSLNVTVTLYVQAEATKALENIHASLPHGDGNINIKYIFSRAKVDMAIDIAALRQEFKQRLTDLENSFADPRKKPTANPTEYTSN